VPRLQHRFAGSEVGVRGFDGSPATTDAFPEVAIFDASGDLGETVRGAAAIRRRCGGMFAIMIVPHGLRSAEWRLRDLGADIVVPDDIGADELARICRHALRIGPQIRESN
jgi:hypothetical protein